MNYSHGTQGGFTNGNQYFYHSNETYWVVFSFGAVYYAVQGGSNV